ncbi:MAG: phosphatase PAP2 family protein [Bacteroidales bacterium]|nr:phosphatase PAP2 family protein [Bacteroidales bacterium]
MKFFRIVFAVLALTSLSAGARAQYARDTVCFRPTQLIAPVALMGTGACIHYFGHESIDAGIRDWNLSHLNVDGNGLFLDFGTYFAYGSPAVFLGAGLLGARPKHAFVDRTVEAAISYSFAYSTGFILKRVMHTLRPDGSDYRSFPSGHTLFAFTSAELMRNDYGPWWGAAFYTMACGTAAERIYGNRHWFSDVLAGAGLGILSAHIGIWLLEPVKSLFSIPDISWDGLSSRNVQIAFTPSADPYSGTPTANLSILF